MMARAPLRLVSATVKGPAGDLEALLQTREDGAHAISALVCHPHPLYGGTMNNKVAHRVSATLADLDLAVLRFNFRGAGGSEGSFDEGVGELEDARAALAHLRVLEPTARRWLAGFSFGSWIAARLAVEEPDVERVILVAPPVDRSGFELLETSPLPKLVIQGTADVLCPIASLSPKFARWADPKRLILVPGASHFFDKQLGDLAEALREGLSEAL